MVTLYLKAIARERGGVTVIPKTIRTAMTVGALSKGMTGKIVNGNFTISRLVPIHRSTICLAPFYGISIGRPTFT
jgi:hypothetical protein